MGGGGGGSSSRQLEIQEEMNAMMREQFEFYKDEKAKQQVKVEQQRESFEAFKFTNPFDDAKNEFAGLQTDFRNLGATAFEGMENRFEDMTVDMRAADFQAQQGQQQRANILQSLRGSAGTSGVAGLAQTMANQGALQTQQIAAGISQQERQNQMLAAQEGSRIEQMQRQATLTGGEMARQMGVGRENLIAQGQGVADRMIMQGEAAVQGAEFGRESTLLASEYGLLTGANQALQGAESNVMSSMASEADMWGSRAQAANQNKSNLLSTAVTAYKIYAMCIPKGTRIDAIGGNIKIEDIRPGDMIMGYDGYPVKVLHKHEYLEDPSVKRWYEIEFSDGEK